MATTRRATGSGSKESKANEIFGKVKSIILSTQGFPIFIAFTTLAVMFVVFRMKNVEMDYKISKTNKEIEKVVLDNKELKAKKARMLSAEKLRTLADRHSLTQPKQNQIIVIQ